MDSDIPPEEGEQYQHSQAAAFKSPSQKPSKIPRLVSSPAKAKPASKVSSITPETSSRDMRLVQLFFQTPHSPPTKPGRSTNRDSEQKEIDEFEEEERRLLELDQQVCSCKFVCIFLHFCLELVFQAANMFASLT